MRRRVPDHKDSRGEQLLSGHPIYARERDNVERFVQDLRAAQGPADYHALHQALLGNFIGCQRFLERLALEKQELKDAIRELASAGKTAELRALSRRVKGVDLDEHAGKAVLSLYRTLGDSLVWALLGYRRAAITVLGEGRRVGRLAADEGLSAELSELEWLWEERGVVA